MLKPIDNAQKMWYIIFKERERLTKVSTQSQRVEAVQVEIMQIIFRSRLTVIQNFLGKVGESDGIRTVHFTDSPQRLVCSYTLRK